MRSRVNNRIGVFLLGGLLVSLLLAPVPPGHATDGRDFAVFFNYTGGSTAGDAVSVTFTMRVNNHSGADVTGVSLLSAPMACDAAPTAIVEELLSSPGSTVFRYDATTNQFIYNWQSASSWRGCRLLQVTLSDGTQHWAKFNFK